MIDLPLQDAAPSPAPKPEYTNPAIEAAKAAPDFAEKVARFQSLADTVTDTTGKFTDEQKLQAYVAVVDMSVTGQLLGIGNAGMARSNEVYTSAFGQKVSQLQRDHQAATMRETGGANAGRAALAQFDGLSASDKDILFQTTLNPPLRDGKKFANVRAWQDNMNAMIQMTEYTQENRDLIASGATSKAEDPKFAAALKLNNSGDVGSANWSSMVLKLFEGPKDKIDLSDGAKRLVGDVKDTARAGPRYQEGSIATKTV